jgi:hypothetical protein
MPQTSDKANAFADKTSKARNPAYAAHTGLRLSIVLRS